MNEHEDTVDNVISACGFSADQAAWERVKVELRALRKVADAASKLVDEINTADLIDDIPDSVEYADVLEALAKAGR